MFGIEITNGMLIHEHEAKGDKKPRVLVIGPDPSRSKGGVASVIDEIINSQELNEAASIQLHPSYIDGNFLARLYFSVSSFIKLCFTYRLYDIFHIHMATNGSFWRKKAYIDFLKRCNRKVIVHIHGGGFLLFYERLSSRQKRSVAKTLKKADVVVALSKSWKQSFETIFGLENIAVIPNGVDCSKLRMPHGKDLPSNGEILFLGKICSNKGVYDLLNALSILKARNVVFTCKFAGEGETKKLQCLIDESGLSQHVEIAGWVSGELKYQILNESSILVLPSYFEGLPMSILEAMGAGRAIVATKVGAIEDVVEQDVNGLLVQAGDYESLALSLEVLIGDREKLENISKCNYQKIRNYYDVKSMCLSIKLLYRTFSAPQHPNDFCAQSSER